jgi:hypothetical protein
MDFLSVIYMKKHFKKTNKKRRSLKFLTRRRQRDKNKYKRNLARGPKVAQKPKEERCGSWVKKYSKRENRDYWFNETTGETTWNIPPECIWTKLHSAKYDRDYWYNEGTRATTWERPAEYVSPLREIERRTLVTAIIVPFREDSIETGRRTEQLMRFLDYMTEYLGEHPYKIYVIEQEDDGKGFNRGKLLNIGFRKAKEDGCSLFIFHDVDLLPSPELLRYYVEPNENPVHIADVWKDRYQNRANKKRTYLGGAVSFPRDKFEALNGFPNNFWGWGGEDDELLLRTNELGYTIENPREGSMTDLENMNWEQKNGFLRENNLKFMRKRETLAEHAATWKTNGLSDLEYRVLSENNDRENVSQITVYL